MPVHIYDKNGLIETLPDSEWKQAGIEIHRFNKTNPDSLRKLLIADAFPPDQYIFDGTLGDIRPMNVVDLVNQGAVHLRPGDQIVHRAAGPVVVPRGAKLDSSGSVVPMNITEQVQAGLVSYDPTREKIEGDRIVPRTLQDMLDDGSKTTEDLVEIFSQRLRANVERYFAANVTANGYRLDNLARQKAALTMQYRQFPDADPVKADLLQRKVIYTDAIVDEILNEIERVQSAYDQAKNALQSIANQNQPVSVFDSVKLEDYLTAP